MGFVFTLLELVWAFYISWQSSDLAEVTEVDDLRIERMRADNSELEVMWEDVLRATREARKPYHENNSESRVKPGALCPSCGEIETSQANSGGLFSHRLLMVM